jgi:hypothetical protein
MAINNLRVIYQNLADLSTTTITANTTAGTSYTFTGSITGNTLTVATGTSIAIGMYLSSLNIPPNTYIISGSGTTWTLNQSLSTAQSNISIIAITSTTPVGNLIKDTKSLVWRAGGTTSQLNVAFGSSKIVRGVVLPFTNLTKDATITVTPSGGTGNTAVTGSACPYKQTDAWDSTYYLQSASVNYLPQGVNNYAYGSGAYARIWFPTAQTCTGLTIVINDTSNPAGYIEASRLVVGDYWTPTYNTSFGLMSAPKSLSSTMRTESGDLVTNRGIQYNSMSFDLTWLTPADRLVFIKIIKSNGLNKPLLISLFPDAAEDFDKEQTYQIYGKLTQIPDLTHPMYSMYSSKVEIEEI